MGQQLFEPPDVAGWDLGPGWFSSGAMLARMNFAAHARDQPEVQPARSVARRTVDRRRALVSLHARSPDAAAVCRRRRTRRCIDYTRAGGAWTGSDAQLRDEGAPALVAPDRRVAASISSCRSESDRPHGDHETRVRSRRRGGVHGRLRGAGVSVATSRGRRARSRRNLVVLYLSGGNDALSTLIPYTDPRYYRAPADDLAIPAANVLQIGTDSAGKPLGLHPRLTGLRTIFNEGRLALIQRTGYANSSRSHFQGTDIWSTADPSIAAGHRLARAAISTRCRRPSIR